MNFFKKLGCGICSLVLKLSLLIFALTFALVGVLGAPDHLKRALNESGTYDNVVKVALDATTNDLAKQPQQIDLNTPEVKQAAIEAFPADTIASWSEQFIDGIYGWMDGSTKEPEFRIDTSAQQDVFAQNIANLAVQKAESLRPCSRQESLELSRQEIDLFDLPCRPPIDLSGERERLTAQIKDNNNIFGSDNVINAKDITANTEGQDQFKASPIPTAFQWSKRLPVIAAGVMAISSATLVWLSSDKRRGFKKVGLSSLGAAIFLLVTVALFGSLFNRVNGSISKLPATAGEALNGPLTKVAESLFGTFNTQVILISLIYLTIAVVILLTLRFTRHPKGAVPKRFQ